MTDETSLPVAKAQAPTSPARRRFLSAGLAGASVAAVSLGVSATPAAASESEGEKKKARYQESAHVKKFYATNRY